MKKLLTVLLFFSQTGLFGAAPDSIPEIRQVIDRFFEGIYQGDTSLIRSTLAPEARLMSISMADPAAPLLTDDSIGKFLQAIATSQGPGFYHEKLWNYDIRLDDPIATAWTDYTFFLNGQLNHCGSNAFQLARQADGWRIIQIIDTRRKEGCLTEEGSLEKALHALLDAWHHAAAVADEDTFFGSMAPEGIYLGTDLSERWTTSYMAFWAKPYFEKESAWAFTAHDRHIYFNEAQTLAWFEEQLDTWMGPCRGSGVLRLYPEGWKIEHYNLAVAVANDKMERYLKKVLGKRR
jgi:hypothetical protein